MAAGPSIDTSAADRPSKHEPTCATCEHYRSAEERTPSTDGFCWRQPPQTIGIAKFGRPNVLTDDVCGEHNELVAQRNADLAQAIAKALPDYQRELERVHDAICYRGNK